MKNKIGINASFLRKPNTGIGQVTLNFLRKLSECKAEFEFILYLEEDLPNNFRLPQNFRKRIFLPLLWKRDDLIRKIWWEKYLLPKKVKKDQCDAFISLYQCSSIYQYMEIKHIMIVHDIIPKLFPEYLGNARKKLYWRLTERAVKKADKIIAISKNTEKDLIKHLNIDGGKIATNYIDVDETYKKSVSQKESARVLRKYKLKPGYIFAGGGYEARKNVESVVRAYKLLLEQNGKAYFVSEMPRLVVYGQLLPPRLNLAFDAQKLLKELNLTERVRLLGAVPQKDMPALFSNAKCFIYPSHYEGFGLPVLEAMGSGTPVITSKNSSLPEVGGDSVLYCHSDDISDIAMVLKNLLVKDYLRKELTRRGQERAKKFSWDNFIKKVLNIVKNLKE